MRNWQRLKCDGIGPPQLSEMGCGMMFHLSAHSANRRAPVASWQVRKRSLKEFIPPAGRTALERAGLRTRDPIGAPSLSGSALRSHLMQHRCGRDVCGCNDICESVNRLNHRTGDPAQISPAEAFDLSIDSRSLDRNPSCATKAPSHKEEDERKCDSHTLWCPCLRAEALRQAGS